MNHSFELPSPSSDIITSVRFLSSSNRLYASSFDGSLSIYNTDSDYLLATSNSSNNNSNNLLIAPSNSLINVYNTKSPILSTTTINNKIYSGQVTGKITCIDVNKDKMFELPMSHQLGVQTLNANSSRGLIVSSSWDKIIKFQGIESNNELLKEIKFTDEKINAIDSNDTLDQLLVSLSNNKTHLYDFRKLNYPLKVFDNGFNYQCNNVKFLNNNDGFIQSSIEGKCSLEFFNNNNSLDNYVFKCHRKKQVNPVTNEDEDLVNPIHSLIILNEFENKFLTGGSDSSICLWDYKTRKRLKQYKNFANDLSIMAMDYNNDAELLGIGLSDDSFKNVVGLNDLVNSTPFTKSKLLVKYKL